MHRFWAIIPTYSNTDKGIVLLFLIGVTIWTHKFTQNKENPNSVFRRVVWEHKAKRGAIVFLTPWVHVTTYIPFSSPGQASWLLSTASIRVLLILPFFGFPHVLTADQRPTSVTFTKNPLSWHPCTVAGHTPFSYTILYLIWKILRGFLHVPIYTSYSVRRPKKLPKSRKNWMTPLLHITLTHSWGHSVRAPTDWTSAWRGHFSSSGNSSEGVPQQPKSTAMGQVKKYKKLYCENTETSENFLN